MFQVVSSRQKRERAQGKHGRFPIDEDFESTRRVPLPAWAAVRSMTCISPCAPVGFLRPSALAYRRPRLAALWKAFQRLGGPVLAALRLWLTYSPPMRFFDPETLAVLQSSD